MTVREAINELLEIYQRLCMRQTSAFHDEVKKFTAFNPFQYEITRERVRDRKFIIVIRRYSQISFTFPDIVQAHNVRMFHEFH